MDRKRGNPAIVSVGEGRRTGADGRPVSYGTQAAFKKFKRDFDRRLQAAGIHQLKPKNLKPKHVNLVVGQLRAEVEAGTRSIGSAKNWLAHLRAFVRAIDRRYLVPRTNTELGFGNRVYVPSESKALVLTGGHLERVTCPYVAVSLKLQREFGLRREEAMKIQPDWADKGDRLRLRDTWCKGKRARVLPIRTASQTGRPRRSQGACRDHGKRVADPHREVRAAGEAIRVPVPQGGHQRLARPAARIRPAALPGTGRVCLPAGGRAEAKGHDAGDAPGGPRGAA